MKNKDDNRPFRAQLLTLIKGALNTIGMDPYGVVKMIEERLTSGEIKHVLDYVRYYCSDENKEIEQHKAYQNWLVIMTKVNKLTAKERKIYYEVINSFPNTNRESAIGTAMEGGVSYQLINKH